MRNILICFTCLACYSCNINSDTSYYFKNKTTDTIDIKFFNQENETVQIKIAPETDYMFLRVVGISSGPSKMSLGFNDSIFVSKNDTTIKFYRDNSAKNQIYNMDNWPLTKAINSLYEYTYTFSKEDFN